MTEIGKRNEIPFVSTQLRRYIRECLKYKKLSIENRKKYPASNLTPMQKNIAVYLDMGVSTGSEGMDLLGLILLEPANMIGPLSEDIVVGRLNEIAKKIKSGSGKPILYTQNITPTDIDMNTTSALYRYPVAAELTDENLHVNVRRRGVEIPCKSWRTIQVEEVYSFKGRAIIEPYQFGAGFSPDMLVVGTMQIAQYLSQGGDENVENILVAEKLFGQYPEIVEKVTGYFVNK